MKTHQPDFDRGAPAATDRWPPASPPIPWSPASDWRALPDADVEPLLQAETEAWRGDLYWDVRDSWQVIQPARRAGYLPGLVARDPTGRHQGWTCFFVDRRCLQVMIFVSSSGPATTRLVDLLLASPHAQSALEVSFFVRDGAPGLAASLEARAFETEDYRYLLADLTAGPAGGRAGRVGSRVKAQHVIDAGFRDAAARLLARAYAPSRELRVFAPHGTLDEWRDYVGNLLHSRDCGSVLPSATMVARSPGGELEGLVITTKVSDGTAHIAQCSVDPDARGRGCARQLVHEALKAAARVGCTRATLLVSATNARALAIYEDFGFRDRGRFLAARCVPRAR